MKQGLPVGDAFFPLAEYPDMQQQVFAPGAAAPCRHRPRQLGAAQAEKSVCLMAVNSGGLGLSPSQPAGTAAPRITSATATPAGNLEARHPPPRASAGHGTAAPHSILDGEPGASRVAGGSAKGGRVQRVRGTLLHTGAVKQGGSGGGGNESWHRRGTTARSNAVAACDPSLPAASAACIRMTGCTVPIPSTPFDL